MKPAENGPGSRRRSRAELARYPPGHSPGAQDARGPFLPARSQQRSPVRPRFSRRPTSDIGDLSRAKFTVPLRLLLRRPV